VRPITHRQLVTVVSVTTIVVVAGFLAACDNKGKGASGGPAAKPGSDKPAPTGTGVIQGSVRFAGSAPAPKDWGGKDFVGCKGKRPDSIQPVRVADGKLADAFVYVKDGLPPGSYSAPSSPVVVDQKGCEYEPRVFGAMADQPVRWANSDPIMHNVNTGQYNQGLASAGITFEKPLHATGSPMITVKCDVHPWMRAYAGVMDHPYFQVTKSDGAFSITGLVDGEYTLAVWHEVLGTQEKKIKVTATAPVTVEFEMKQ
jgi:hypothetical protein